MASHTPGPWEANKELLVYGKDPSEKNMKALVADCNPYRICESGTIDEERWQANARLIAAAPELFAACKAALGLETEEPSPAWDMIRAAIAKAEGKS